MKIIEIRTQAELDTALKGKAKDLTLQVFGGTPDNPLFLTVVGWGSSNLTVVGWESSNLTVEGWGSSNLKVVGRESSNLTVEGWESSNLTVVGAENSIFRIYSDMELKLFQQAVAIAQECSPKILHQDQTAQLLKTLKSLHDLNSFLAIKEIEPINGKVTLYKYVRDDFKDHYSGTLSYEPGGIVTEPNWDPDPERQCGRGLHFSASLRDAQGYNSSGRAIACEVAMEDIVIWPHDISKVRCREVRVIEEVKS